jgi:hypothetical protein
MDVRGRLNRASSWLGAGRFVAVRDVASLIESSPHFFGLQRRWDTKEVLFTQRENIQCKSFWRLNFVSKERSES